MSNSFLLNALQSVHFQLSSIEAAAGADVAGAAPKPNPRVVTGKPDDDAAVLVVAGAGALKENPPAVVVDDDGATPKEKPLASTDPNGWG